MATKNKNERRARIKRGLRFRIRGTAERPRLTVFRSNLHIYAQIIDDTTGRTLVAASSIENGVERTNPTELGRIIGQRVAERAKEAGIEQVVFDRNGYRYHGRVKALAEGARTGGLQF